MVVRSVGTHTPGTCIQTTAAESMGTQASQQTFAMRRDELLMQSETWAGTERAKGLPVALGGKQYRALGQ